MKLDKNQLLPESEISPRDTGMRYGVILALAGIIIQGIMHVMGSDPASGGGGLGCLSGIISIAILSLIHI